MRDYDKVLYFFPIVFFPPFWLYKSESTVVPREVDTDRLSGINDLADQRDTG